MSPNNKINALMFWGIGTLFALFGIATFAVAIYVFYLCTMATKETIAALVFIDIITLVTAMMSGVIVIVCFLGGCEYWKSEIKQ
jgi:hypothetical protein